MSLKTHFIFAHFMHFYAHFILLELNHRTLIAREHKLRSLKDKSIFIGMQTVAKTVPVKNTGTYLLRKIFRHCYRFPWKIILKFFFGIKLRPIKNLSKQRKIWTLHICKTSFNWLFPNTPPWGVSISLYQSLLQSLANHL